MNDSAGKICPACTANNLQSARFCEVCGAALPKPPDPPDPPRTVLGETDEELQMSYVPQELREAIRNFDDEAEAELAAGLLRTNGFPAELGRMIIPGLPYQIALWVGREDVVAARALLDETEAAARGPQAVE